MQVMFGWQETQEKIKKRKLCNLTDRRKPKFSSFTFPRAKKQRNQCEQTYQQRKKKYRNEILHQRTKRKEERKNV